MGEEGRVSRRVVCHVQVVGRWARGSPGVSPRLQRRLRLRLRRVDERRRGRGLLLSTATTAAGGDGDGGDYAHGRAHPFSGQAAAAAALVGPAGRRQLILPTPPPRPAGQRPRKKMRLPEIQQLVRSLTMENDGLREEMVALQRACTALSKENCKLETRLEKSSKRNGTKSEGQQARPQPDEPAAKQESQNGFVLPDLNLPVEDMAADGSAP
uniref:BZIP domain-containing protein n=1 Tax=Oryza barthii TaxID=65489 RepID=A0A0D3GJ93_9ORYZ